MSKPKINHQETKPCSKCKEEKPLDAYSKDATKPTGRQAICRVCRTSGPKKKQPVPEGMKKCGKCKHVKLFSEFSRNNARHDGCQAVCKACRNSWNDYLICNYSDALYEFMSRLLKHRGRAIEEIE